LNNNSEIKHNTNVPNKKEMIRLAQKSLVVQQAQAALDQLKFEVAQEIGVQLSPTGYNGNLATRDAGAIGGNITKRLVQIAEQQISGGMRSKF
jgi:hypothetical protein